MLGYDGDYRSPKSQILMLSVKNNKKLAVKQSIEKPILLNFVNLSPTLCPRLQMPSNLDIKL